MPINRNALMRMRTIDSCLRRRQRLWTIEDLQEACEDALYEYEGISEISTRTIRRDLQLMRSDKLGYNAPIIVVDKKYYTYEDPDYSITQLPLSDSDLAELSSAMDIIRHYGNFRDMEGQEDILARMHDRIQSKQNGDSHHRVIYLETNQQLKGLNFLGTLYDHITKRQAIEVNYRSFNSAADVKFCVSPYLLKEFNNRWFMLGYCKAKNMLMTLALDRIVGVRADWVNEYVENTFFDPEKYFDEIVGVSRNISGDPVEIRLKVDADQAPYVITKPLHTSQVVEERLDDGSIVVALRLIPNFEFNRLILGFAFHIEVLSPEFIRKKIAAMAKATAANYEE